MAIALATRTDSQTVVGRDTEPVFRMANLTKVYQMGEVAVHALRGVTLDVLFQTIAVPKNPNGKPGDRVVTLRVRKRGEKTVLVDVNVTQGTVRGP